MSTGNNQGETIVTKKRKRTLHGYIHPNRPEIKKFDFFDGGAAETGSSHIHNSKEYLALLNPVGSQADQVGAYTLVNMVDPYQGSASYQRVGMKYFLKYIKFKGHIGINPTMPFTLRYKLLLIKSDWQFASADDFFQRTYCNYEPLINNSFAATERYCRHNFYKTYKWAAGQAEFRTSVMVVTSGTLSPVDYIPKPTKASTLGSQPSWTYTLPDLPRITSTDDTSVDQVSYLPINVSVQVNDNVEVGVTHFYLMLVTDHGIGVDFPYYGSGSQYLYRASYGAINTPARFNFFGCCYFTDL